MDKYTGMAQQVGTPAAPTLDSYNLDTINISWGAVALNGNTSATYTVYYGTNSSSLTLSTVSPTYNYVTAKWGLTLPGITPGTYYVRVSAAGNLNTTPIDGPSAQFIINPRISITGAPPSAVVIGTPVTLTAFLTGVNTGTLIYVWFMNGNRIVGANTPNYNIPTNEVVSNTYTVTLINSSGYSIESAPVNVTIENAPTSDPNAICFLGNAPVLTPSGYRRIDSLRVGDKVQTADGRTVAIQRLAVKRYEPSASVNPYVIPKGQFGATENLLISPLHRVAVGGRGMIEARELGLCQFSMRAAFDYYNIELPNWETDNMVVAGVEAESLAPVRRMEITKTQFLALVKAKYGKLTPDVIARVSRVCFFTAEDKVSIPMLKRASK